MRKVERDKTKLIQQGFTPEQSGGLFFMRWLWRKRMRRRIADTRSLKDWVIPRPSIPKRPTTRRGANGYDSF